MLYVLAPTMRKRASSTVDQEFIDVQFGVLKGQLESVLKSKTLRKPNLVVLFVNKFDLFSSLPPDDPDSSDDSAKIVALFKRHIENIELAGGKLGPQGSTMATKGVKGGLGRPDAFSCSDQFLAEIRGMPTGTSPWSCCESC